MAATLAGGVTLGAGGQKNIVVRFFTPDTDTEIHKSASVTDASGNFYVYDAPVGTYDVGIKCDSSLSLLAEDEDFTEGNTTDINFGTLLHGDLNDSDKVDAADVSILSPNYDLSGACSGYAGDWLLPEVAPPVAGGAATKLNRGLN